MFLKLSRVGGKEKVRVNISGIVSYTASFDGGTEQVDGSKVTLQGIANFLFVKETPEEIDRMLREGYHFIKET